MSELLTGKLIGEFSRKSFVKGGGALVVGFSFAGAGLARTSAAAESPFASSGPPDPGLIDSWLTVHADNTVSVLSGAIELGQGTSVGMSLIAAEELDVDLKQMRFVNQDTNLTPNTGQVAASASIENRGPMVRAAAVEARKALLGMASAKLGVPVSGLTVAAGVVSGGGRAVSYGELLGDKLFSVTMPASYGLTMAAVAGRTAPGLAAGGPARPCTWPVQLPSRGQRRRRSVRGDPPCRAASRVPLRSATAEAMAGSRSRWPRCWRRCSVMTLWTFGGLVA